MNLNNLIGVSVNQKMVTTLQAVATNTGTDITPPAVNTIHPHLLTNMAAAAAPNTGMVVC